MQAFMRLLNREYSKAKKHGDDDNFGEDSCRRLEDKAITEFGMFTEKHARALMLINEYRMMLGMAA